MSTSSPLNYIALTFPVNSELEKAEDRGAPVTRKLERLVSHEFRGSLDSAHQCVLCHLLSLLHFLLKACRNLHHLSLPVLQ